MSGIYWIASYPKSGNTWLRAFLANLRSESSEAIDINKLKGLTIAAARAPFDEAVGFGSCELTPEEIDALRPAVYEHLAAQAGDDMFFKVHDAFTDIDGYPLLGGASILGAIYIVRNPLDVAVSLAEHIGESVVASIRHMNDERYCFCGETSRLPRQLRQRLLSWSGHVLSWVNALGVRVHVMRYEDMKSLPLETFAAAAAFLGLPSEPEKIRAALGHSDLEVLRRMERERGFRERSPHAKSFFTRGTSGAYRTVLTPEQIASVICVHQNVMKQFGYLDDNGEPTC